MSAPGDSHGKSAALDFIRSPGFERLDADRTRNVLWIWQTLGSSPMTDCQPYDPAAFGNDLLGDHSPAFIEPRPGTFGNRFLFWAIGLWEGCQFPLPDELPFIPTPNCPGFSGSTDVNSEVGLGIQSPLGIITGTPALNRIENIASPNEAAIYWFDRIIDVRAGFGADNFSDLTLSIDLNALRTTPHETILNAVRKWFHRHEESAHLSNLFLPGLPPGTMAMGFNAGFLGGYFSNDTTPFYIFDNEVPRRFTL